MLKTIIFLLLIPIFSFAHPHAFVDVAVNHKIKNNQIQTIKIAWYFDEMTSQILLMDYDKNRDLKFSQEESQLFKENVFDTLDTDEYYTHIKIDNKKIPMNKRIKDFYLTFEKNKFVVNYTVSLQDISQNSLIDIGFWDKEFFNSFDIASKFVTFNGKKLKFEIEEVEDDIFMGVVLKLKI